LNNQEAKFKSRQYSWEPPVPCGYCKHLDWTPISKTPPGEQPLIDGWTVYTCKAFPDGIGKELYDGNTHQEAITGDNGVRFELTPGMEAPWRR
jgi:hypothetical protein